MRSLFVLGAFVLAAAAGACGSDDTLGDLRGTGGNAGSGGVSGLGGTAGVAGAAGVGGDDAAGGAAGMGGLSGSAGTGGLSGGAGAGGSGGAPVVGACTNSGDAAAIANAGGSLESIGATCAGSTCLGQLGDPDAYASCVSTCIETNVPGLSSDCAGCYGELGGCAVGNLCLACASDTCSTTCLDCLNGAECLTRLEECTGIPVEVCP